MDKGILRKWLKAGYLEKGAFYETESGTPQGGILSPVLANMTLGGLERNLRTRFGGKYPRQAAKVNVVRYADDGAPRRRTGDASPPCSHAAQEMRAGPSEPPCRRRLQTTRCGCVQETRW